VVGPVVVMPVLLVALVVETLSPRGSSSVAERFREQARGLQVGAKSFSYHDRYAEPAGDVLYISDRAVRDSTEDEQVQVAQLRRAYAGRHPGMWRRCGDSTQFV